MKKNALYISLAVAATFLFALKCSNLMTPWMLSFSENNRKCEQTETTLTERNYTRMDQAIRQQLDADAKKIIEKQNTSVSRAEVLATPQPKIISIYAKMLPDEAAQIIETMEIEDIIDLLQLLDTETASAILSHMDIQKAQTVTLKMLETLKAQ